MSVESLRTAIKYLFIPLLFLATLLLVGSWWFFSREPAAEEKFGKIDPVKITSVLSEEIKTANSVNIKKTPNTPGVVEVYLKEQTINGKTLAKRLGFKGKSKKIGNQLVWQTKTESLKFNPETLYFSFKNTQVTKKGSFRENEATQKAKQKLKELGLVGNIANLEAVTTQYLYTVKYGHALNVDSAKGANTLVLSFGFKLGGYSLINEKGSKVLFEVWVGVDKKIKKISGQAQPLKFKDRSTYKVKAVKVAIEDLQKGQGVLVNVDAPVNTAFGGIQIRHTSVQLSHLMTNKGKYLQPVYLFEGTTFGTGGKTVKTKSITTALAE